MTTTRLNLSTLHNADENQLDEELAAGGQDSSIRSISTMRGDVARLLAETFGPFELCDENNDVIRDATTEETVESVMSGPEGWILVDGRRCYVTE